VWLLDRLRGRAAAPALVRIGQAQCQLWTRSFAGWALKAALPCQHLKPNQVQDLSSIVGQLLTELPAPVDVQVIVDSRWMPLSWVQIGTAVLAKPQMDALLQHRFADVYGEEARKWSCRSTYVSGDPWTFAVGIPERLLAAVAEACATELMDSEAKAGRTRIIGVESSFTWAWNQTPNRGRGGWCLAVLEQDRTLLATIKAGRLTAMNVAAPPLHDVTNLQAFLGVQWLRAGVTHPPQACTLVSWEPLLNQDALRGEGVDFMALGQSGGAST
jgi:hypothetical protein